MLMLACYNAHNDNTNMLMFTGTTMMSLARSILQLKWKVELMVALDEKSEDHQSFFEINFERDFNICVKAIHRMGV